MPRLAMQWKDEDRGRDEGLGKGRGKCQGGKSVSMGPHINGLRDQIDLLNKRRGNRTVAMSLRPH